MQDLEWTDKQTASICFLVSVEGAGMLLWNILGQFNPQVGVYV